MAEKPEREIRVGVSTGECSGSSRSDRSISTDAILSAVANRQRRAVLDTLDDAPEKTLGYDALVDRVADRVRDDHSEVESDERRQRVRITLHHTHLPKLDEAGLVDYEAETGRVEYVGGELQRDLVALIERYEAESA